MTAIRGVLLAALAAGVGFGQGQPVAAQFEVASIRPSAQLPPGQVGIGVHVDGAQVRCNYLSLRDYIFMAYQVKSYQVTGPEWLASAHFDISAKLPEGATRQQVPEMLQELLANRFQVKLHREKKELPVYVLGVAKGGLKMKESPPDADSDGIDPTKAPVNVTTVGNGPDGPSIGFGRGSYFAFRESGFEAKKLTMTSFVAMLARFMDRPVVDMTDLPGSYDFTLKITPEEYRALKIRAALGSGMTLPPEAVRLLADTSNESLLAALQGLGLKLEPRKEPLDMIVVDHAEKTPTDN